MCACEGGREEERSRNFGSGMRDCEEERIWVNVAVCVQGPSTSCGLWCVSTQVEHGGTEETINVGAFSSGDRDMTQTDGAFWFHRGLPSELSGSDIHCGWDLSRAFVVYVWYMEVMGIR